MKKILFYTNLIFLLLILNCATEQKTLQQANIPQEKCDAPILYVGDTWRWRTQSWDKSWVEYKVFSDEGDSYVIENIEPEFKRIVSEREPESITTVIFKVNKKTLRTKEFKTQQGWRGRIDSGNAFSVPFPIFVGKKWNEWNGGVVCDLKVVAYEDITVPAGTTKAFKIECYIRIDLLETIWYSPKIKAKVKSASASPLLGSIELISYKIKSD